MHRMYLHFQMESFGLCAALRKASGPAAGSAGPAALVDDGGRVRQLNPAAEARGLSPGMRAAQALARCAEVVLLSVDEAAERAAARAVWQILWEITPQIELGAGACAGSATLELVRPDVAVVQAQTEAALRALQQQGLPARAGFAPTPEWAGFAALAAERGGLQALPHARRVRELLGQLPLTVLSILEPKHREVLEGWGVRQLAALAALPRQALGERLGPVGLEAWDVLNGKRQRALQVRELPPEFVQQIDLEEPVADFEALNYYVEQGVQGLERALQERGQLARAIAIELHLERAGRRRRVIRLPEATSRAALLTRLLRSYLAALSLKAGVCALQLSVDPVDPIARQAGLFERSVRNPWRLQETLDQLAGLLGAEAFGTPRCRDTHRPDSFQLLPLSEELASSGAASAAGQPGSRPEGPPQMGPPLRRFRPPLSAQVRFAAARPVWVGSALVSGTVSGAQGPYELSGDWAEAEPWRQREWDVMVDGEGLFRLSGGSGQWQLVGAYD